MENKVLQKILAPLIWKQKAVLSSMLKQFEQCGGDVSTFDEECERGYKKNDKGECIPDEGEGPGPDA